MSKSKLSAMLLIVVLPMFACQFLRPGMASCRVNMPDRGWVSYRDGSVIKFAMDGTDWTARVDCSSGQLVDGQPVAPAHAHETVIPVEETSYRLLTSDPGIKMVEYHENGSHVRIEDGDTYYVAVLSFFPGNLGQAVVRYFMGGQAPNGMVHMYCYDRTPGEPHTALPVMTRIWTVSEPVAVSMVCAGHNFILELSAEISPAVLGRGPTPTPTLDVPTLTPDPPGLHTGLWPRF